MRTSTHSGGFSDTSLSYKIDNDEISTEVYPENETLAILQFMTNVVRSMEANGTIEVHSLPNTFTEPFTKGWIDGWVRDGFRKKPASYRAERKQFWELLQQRQIEIEIHIRSEAELNSVLEPRSHDRPGTPNEHPWAKPESSDDLLQRSLERSK